MKRVLALSSWMSAVLVFSVIVVASASAKPSFVPENGKFPILFTGTASNPTTLKPTLTSETANPITCGNDTSTGEITGAMEVSKVVVTFTGCETEVLGSKVSCGTIKTTTLSGALGDVGISRVGVMLFPASGTLYAEFKCSVVTIKVTGTGLIGEIPFLDLNKQSAIINLVYKNIGAKQELTELELLGGTHDRPELTSSVGNKAAQMSEDTLTSAVRYEVES